MSLINNRVKTYAGLSVLHYSLTIISFAKQKLGRIHIINSSASIYKGTESNKHQIYESIIDLLNCNTGTLFFIVQIHVPF